MRCLLLVVVLFATLAVSKKPSTLVLLDDNDYKNTHSAFFHSLQDRGHQLTFKHVYDEDNTLDKYGEYMYDNLILFAPSAQEFGERITPDVVIKFVDSGRNLLVAVNSNISEPVREVANECGVDFDEEQTGVIDHVNFDASDEQQGGRHTLVALSNVNVIPVITGNPAAPILFSGVGHAATEGSRLLFRILTGTQTTYSASPSQAVTDYPQSVGKDTLLVTAIQARNNARIVFSGSLDLFSNKLFNSPVNVNGKKFDKSGNEQFAADLSKWVFQERGLLRVHSLTHSKLAGGPSNPQSYRIKDEIKFAVIIEEFDQSTDSWKPYVANDVQLSLVMLDPYIRKTLTHDANGKYHTSLRLPDVYGVFKFSINYHRQGYSNLEIFEQVSVHPFRHDEFERFIDVAYPYYISAFSMMGGFFVFGLVFLFTKPSS